MPLHVAEKSTDNLPFPTAVEWPYLLWLLGVASLWSCGCGVLTSRHCHSRTQMHTCKLLVYCNLLFWLPLELQAKVGNANLCRSLEDTGPYGSQADLAMLVQVPSGDIEPRAPSYLSMC